MDYVIYRYIGAYQSQNAFNEINRGDHVVKHVRDDYILKIGSSSLYKYKEDDLEPLLLSEWTRPDFEQFFEEFVVKRGDYEQKAILLWKTIIKDELEAGSFEKQGGKFSCKTWQAAMLSCLRSWSLNDFKIVCNDILDMNFDIDIIMIDEKGFSKIGSVKRLDSRTIAFAPDKAFFSVNFTDLSTQSNHIYFHNTYEKSADGLLIYREIAQYQEQLANWRKTTTNPVE